MQKSKDTIESNSLEMTCVRVLEVVGSSVGVCGGGGVCVCVFECGRLPQEAPEEAPGEAPP